LDHYRIGFYGFGEAASTFALGLHMKWKDLQQVAYDKYSTERTLERAEKSGTTMAASLEELVRQSDAIGSLVTGKTSIQAAEAMCAFMRDDQIYIDFNSISPMSKAQIGSILEKAKIPMVDAAVMGSIPENGLRVSILLSGEGAPAVSARMNALGYNTSVVGTKVGEAAAIKMVRSVFTKGLEALFIEMLLAGKEYGVQEYVIQSVSQSLENKKIRDVMNTLVVSQAVHSARKKSEMDYVIEVLQDVHIEPIMSQATRDYFQWISSLSLFEGVDPDQADYETVIEAIRNRMTNK
jgi:3-hydroxyisobutyrate dehydrogenase-like beta-hydroxyacid dehydrogenase